jgi:hypothetical protein
MGEGTERIDAAIDRLDAVLRAKGRDGVPPASDPDAAARVDAALAPFALPADLRRFWERVDFRELWPIGDCDVPQTCNPDDALGKHQMNLEEFPGLFGPPILFPIATKSEDQWSIELESSAGPGGLVVSHEFGPIVVQYPSFVDLVEVCTELLDEDKIVKAHDRYTVTLVRDAVREKREARLEAAGIDRREFSGDPGDWPAHWRAAAGIQDGDDVRLGTTHTIAELVEASRAAPFSARIAGRIVSIAAFGHETYYVIDDGTAAIDVRCPGAVNAWLSPSAHEIELGVSVEKPIEEASSVELSERDVSADGFLGGMEAFARSVSGFGDALQTRTSVVATDVRPLR